MTAGILDDRRCALGEAALWHPLRCELFWLDILGRCLHSTKDGRKRTWSMPETISATGWIDDRKLFLAGETAFWCLEIDHGAMTQLCDLDADRPEARSNDGRSDPFGGFWIGTMGWQGEPDLGRIWRFFRGELVLLFDELGVPNAICFSPDGRTGYFTDTPTRTIHRVALDADGFPSAPPEDFVKLSGDHGSPDGAVTDCAGNLWVAYWGGGKVVRFDPSGRLSGQVDLPATQPTCPAFGGPDLDALFVTTASAGLADPTPHDGRTYALRISGQKGRPEGRVIL